jgi:hypothetical protein
VIAAQIVIIITLIALFGCLLRAVIRTMDNDPQPTALILIAICLFVFLFWATTVQVQP